jgi:hypothetical protein
MHDIKYIFLNKINQTIQGAKKFLEGQVTDSIIEKHYFLKSRVQLPPRYKVDPPCTQLKE